jgi:hypothetical protein
VFALSEEVLADFSQVFYDENYMICGSWLVCSRVSAERKLRGFDLHTLFVGLELTVADQGTVTGAIQDCFANFSGLLVGLVPTETKPLHNNYCAFVSQLASKHLRAIWASEHGSSFRRAMDMICTASDPKILQTVLSVVIEALEVEAPLGVVAFLGACTRFAFQRLPNVRSFSQQIVAIADRPGRWAHEFSGFLVRAIPSMAGGTLIEFFEMIEKRNVLEELPHWRSTSSCS